MRAVGAAMIVFGVVACASRQAGPFSGGGSRYVTGPPAVAYGVVFVLWGVGFLLLATRRRGPHDGAALHNAGLLAIIVAAFIGMLTSFFVRGC